MKIKMVDTLTAKERFWLAWLVGIGVEKYMEYWKKLVKKYGGNK